MKISIIFAILILNMVVQGWVTILKPITLSLGAAFAALNLDLDLVPELQINKSLYIWDWFLPKDVKKEKAKLIRSVKENIPLEELDKLEQAE